MIGQDRVTGELLSRVRSLNPVVHSITNFVVMNSTANVLLAMGAAPIMAHALEELEEIVSLANSVVINIGTLSQAWVESMVAAAQLAKAKRKPLVLDPVGAGATKFRTQTAKQIIDRHTPTVVRRKRVGDSLPLCDGRQDQRGGFGRLA